MGAPAVDAAARRAARRTGGGRAAAAARRAARRRPRHGGHARGLGAGSLALAARASAGSRGGVAPRAAGAGDAAADAAALRRRALPPPRHGVAGSRPRPRAREQPRHRAPPGRPQLPARRSAAALAGAGLPAAARLPRRRSHRRPAAARGRRRRAGGAARGARPSARCSRAAPRSSPDGPRRELSPGHRCDPGLAGAAGGPRGCGNPGAGRWPPRQPVARRGRRSPCGRDQDPARPHRVPGGDRGAVARAGPLEVARRPGAGWRRGHQPRCRLAVHGPSLRLLPALRAPRACRPGAGAAGGRRPRLRPGRRAAAHGAAGARRRRAGRAAVAAGRTRRARRDRRRGADRACPAPLEGVVRRRLAAGALPGAVAARGGPGMGARAAGRLGAGGVWPRCLWRRRSSPGGRW